MDRLLLLATDWQAVGAIATGVAALGSLAVILLTARMAGSAQKAAEAAGEEAAGAWRPVVLPEHVQATYSGGRTTVWTEVRLRNSGSGPALNLRLSVSSDDESSELPIPTAVLPAEAELRSTGLELPAETTACESSPYLVRRGVARAGVPG
jgi:hypothetical protein